MLAVSRTAVKEGGVWLLGRGPHPSPVLLLLRLLCLLCVLLGGAAGKLHIRHSFQVAPEDPTRGCCCRDHVRCAGAAAAAV